MTEEPETMTIIASSSATIDGRFAPKPWSRATALYRSTEELADLQLVERSRRGDHEAFGELVRRYQRMVFNVCQRMMGERAEAEDMLQDAFLRAYDNLSRYDAQRPLGPWLRRLTTNVCLNRLEQRARQSALPLETAQGLHAQPRWSNPEAVREAGERNERVRSAILALPARYRAVIELRHYQEQSYAEIAEALEIPLSDVKSHLFRARRRMADLLSTEA
jgi:RNA polymerase sigma-70 factor (ECF subfamily)